MKLFKQFVEHVKKHKWQADVSDKDVSWYDAIECQDNRADDYHLRFDMSTLGSEIGISVLFGPDEDVHFGMFKENAAEVALFLNMVGWQLFPRDPLHLIWVDPLHSEEAFNRPQIHLMRIREYSDLNMLLGSLAQLQHQFSILFPCIIDIAEGKASATQLYATFLKGIRDSVIDAALSMEEPEDDDSASTNE